jgi:two-component system chemotaxis sensor kinase CheA
MKSSSAVPVTPNIYPTVRVDIRKLDTLMNLIAELVINRSQIEQLSSELNNQRLEETVEHLNRLTIDLRDQVLKTRMVSIDQVFSRFPRLVRDLSKGTNKEVELRLSGVDTELDRTVIDEIGDPLVHIIRNCVDHGIEKPEEREAAGKPRTGVVSLDAYQTGNSVIITVADDGKGMNPEKIAESALEKGFLTKDAISDLSDQDKINLIFLPGFSTAKEVSDVSGRGVGMDAVKNKITSLGGVINISTEPGQGTKFIIQLPLTLAIIQTLMIQLGEEVYAIPTSFVDQTISVNSKDIKILRHQEVTLLRGEVIPLLRLQDYLGIQNAKNSNLDELDVVVFKTGEKRVGCVVDSLLRQQDVVIKSLGSFLGEIPGIAGATILGDGRVALILDLRDVA